MAEKASALAPSSENRRHRTRCGRGGEGVGVKARRRPVPPHGIARRSRRRRRPSGRRYAARPSCVLPSAWRAAGRPIEPLIRRARPTPRPRPWLNRPTRTSDSEPDPNSHQVRMPSTSNPTVGRLDAGTRVRVLETKYTLDGGLRAAIALASREDVRTRTPWHPASASASALAFHLPSSRDPCLPPAPPPPRPHLTLLPDTAG